KMVATNRLPKLPPVVGDNREKNSSGSDFGAVAAAGADNNAFCRRGGGGVRRKRLRAAATLRDFLVCALLRDAEGNAAEANERNPKFLLAQGLVTPRHDRLAGPTKS